MVLQSHNQLKINYGIQDEPELQERHLQLEVQLGVIEKNMNRQISKQMTTMGDEKLWCL